MSRREGGATPRCVHFGECGGCSLQHIPYPEQLRLKRELVTRLVRAAVSDAPAARPTLAGTPIDNPWGYRQKIHFVFGSDRSGRRLVMGHYARGTRRVIPVRECPVHDERGNTLAFALRDEFMQAGVASAPEGTMKSVVIRAGQHTPELVATLVVTAASDTRVRAATRRVLDSPGPASPSSLHVNVHPRGDAFIFGRETRRISGTERLREDVAGISFLISPTSFFQTNVRAAEILVLLVRAAIPAGARVLDLYAGTGLFALRLARDGCTVVAVEENRDAVADGEASRRLNRIPAAKCRFIARSAEDAIRALRRPPRGRSEPFDVVVLDPTREGCSPPVIEETFGVLSPGTAVYVSCNPETLARDLGAITTHRYRIESLQPVDMFPHTDHIETVAVLRRGSGSELLRR